MLVAEEAWPSPMGADARPKDTGRGLGGQTPRVDRVQAGQSGFQARRSLRRRMAFGGSGRAQIASIVSAAVVSMADGAFAQESSDRLVNGTSEPPRGQWAPAGERLVSRTELDSAIVPAPTKFSTLHGTTRNAEEIGIAFGPVFSQQYSVEGSLYVPEGPTFDRDGSLFITPPIFSSEPEARSNFLVISLDGETGQRRWSAGPAQFGQAGAPLILNDPDSEREVVYSGGYESVAAFDAATGAPLWQTPTNLPAIDPRTGEPIREQEARMFGLNYHAPTDAVISIYSGGFIQAFDRASGALLGELSLVEQFNAAPAVRQPFPGNALIGAVTEVFNSAFEGPSGGTNVEFLIDLLLGNSSIVANFFTIDPDRGSIYLVSTLEDGHPGDTNPGDGFSEAGALYRFDLFRTGDAAVFSFRCRTSFAGGSASTPSVSPDGERIYTADNFSKILAFNRACDQVYSVDVGEQVFGSLSVSSTGREIYASAETGVFKVVENDERTSGEVVFKSNVAQVFKPTDDLEPERRLEQLARRVYGDEVRLKVENFNLATLGENGFAVQSAICIEIPLLDFCAPLALAVSLFDRETGQPINSTVAREETVSVVSTGPDGAIALANSPVRRLLTVALLEILGIELQGDTDAEEFLQAYRSSVLLPLTGGVTKYGVLNRFDLLARDASCAGADRLRNLLAQDVRTRSLAAQADRRDVLQVVQQAQASLERAEVRGEISPAESGALGSALNRAQSALGRNGFRSAQSNLQMVCDALVN